MRMGEGDGNGWRVTGRERKRSCEGERSREKGRVKGEIEG